MLVARKAMTWVLAETKGVVWEGVAMKAVVWVSVVMMAVVWVLVVRDVDIRGDDGDGVGGDESGEVGVGGR